MPSQDFDYSFQPSRCTGIRCNPKILLLVNFLFVIAAGKINAGTTDEMPTSVNTDCETGTKRRWALGTAFLREDRHRNAYSSSWKEIVDGFHTKNSRDDLEGFAKAQHETKDRLCLFHFGKINQLSKFEGENNYELDARKDGKEEHPLRTNLWDLDLKWSFLSRKSKLLSRTKEPKTNGRENNIQLELDPEGYCRIYEKTSAMDNKTQDNSDSPVLAIGRWKKRPWGVTIVVRPLFAQKSSRNSTNFNDNGDNDETRHSAGKKTLDSKENNEMNLVDEETEFVLHANNFHWNGFGSNPKLTQGTILFQRQKRKNIQCWWRSTTSSYSSILPVWPEELSEGNEGVGNDGFGLVRPDLWRLSKILNVGNSNQNRWFRPVVGTFTAKGIMRK